MCQFLYMNYLPNQSSEQASESNQVIVSLIATEKTVITSTGGSSTTNELPLEAELHRRADAMTDVLSQIMERPTTIRHWGLNE